VAQDFQAVHCTCLVGAFPTTSAWFTKIIGLQ